MQRRFLIACLISFLITVSSNYAAFAIEDNDLARLEPTVDLDFVVIQNGQSITVTADLRFPLDFQVIPVLIIGKGTLSVSLSRTNSQGEIVYLYLDGFDVPHTDFNIGITPVTLNVSSTSGLPDSAVGLVISGILFSRENPPYEYNVSFSF